MALNLKIISSQKYREKIKDKKAEEVRPSKALWWLVFFQFVQGAMTLWLIKHQILGG